MHSSPKMSSRLRIALAVNCALIVLIAPLTALSNGTCELPPERESCITDPKVYYATWNAYQVDCVDPSIYVVAPADYNPGQAVNWFYPEEFRYAWTNGNTNAEKYLQIRCRYKDDGALQTTAIMSYIGFPVSIYVDGGDVNALPLFVWKYSDLDQKVRAFHPFEAGDNMKPQFPSFETWFKILEDQFQLSWDLEAQKDIVLNYANLRVRKRKPDVVDIFSKITGCKRANNWKTSAMAPAPAMNPKTMQPYWGCNDSARAAYTAAGGKGAWDGVYTETCLDKFKANYKGRMDAAAFRALIELCQDANALNTGVGLGYNPMPNPLVCKKWRNQSVADRFTGREYILPNGFLNSVPYPDNPSGTWAVVQTDAGTGGEWNLRKGYCNWGGSGFFGHGIGDNPSLRK